MLNYLPQLIIGLDSLGDDANYIHIDDAKEDSDYYCPCCKGLIKPRAYKKDEDYQVQPHFYHVSGGCKEETFVHYICKEWLFVPGCKFIVHGITYEVDSAETEKTLHTSFGDYRPDIIVTTTSGKIFYFEIRVTNRKTELYAPKWDELGNDVVEVDTRYFINQKYKDSIPTFDLIYSEGKCYIKSYTRKDYDHLIGTRKVEWKRQSKLDYKIQWERLDWFWNALSEYKKDESKKDNVIESFGVMDITDRIWCYQNIKGKSCVDIKKEFAENISQYYMQKIYDLKSNDNNIDISVIQKSPLIYMVYIKYNIPFDDYELYISVTVKIKCNSNIFICNIYEIESVISELCSKSEQYILKLSELNTFMKLPYISSIHPKSHHEHNLDTAIFVVEYIDYIHNRYITEHIGRGKYFILDITEKKLINQYNMFKNNSLQKLEIEIQNHVLHGIKRLNDYISSMSWTDGYYLMFFKNKIIAKNQRTSDRRFWDKTIIFELTNDSDISKIYNIIIRTVNNRLREKVLLRCVMNKYMNKINQSHNMSWGMSRLADDSYEIAICFPNYYEIRNIEIKKPYSKNSIESQLCSVMNELASGLYGDIRLLEVDDSIE